MAVIAANVINWLSTPAPESASALVSQSTFDGALLDTIVLPAPDLGSSAPPSGGTVGYATS